MRILALFILGLSVAAYKSLPAAAPQVPACAAVGQTADILFQSADGGTTWEDLSHGLPENTVVTRVLAQDDEVYLAANGGAIFHSQDLKKGVWVREEVGMTLPSLNGVFEDVKSIIGIFPGQSGPYARVYEEGYFQREKETGLWKPIMESLKDKFVHTILENEDGALFAGCESGIYKSVDKGQTWKQVYSEGGVSSLNSAGGVMVGSSSQGLLRSTDGGEHWECVLKDEGGVYNINHIGTQFAAIRIAGDWRNSNGEDPRRTFISADGGESWQRIDDMMSRVWKITDMEQAGDYLFCCHEEGVSRSADGGKSWELVRSSAGLKEPMRYELIVSGKTVYIVKVWSGC